MADTLPCPDGAGSINNPDNQSPDDALPPYVVVEPCIGTWEISGGDDQCALTEAQNQASYAAEIININGAPLNIYKLLGVHEQGTGSIISQGTVFASSPAPGYPVSNIMGAGAWRSSQTGTSISGAAYVGVDFGIDLNAATNKSEYAPPKPNWKKVGAVAIQQGDTAINFARQVRVETTDGSLSVGAITGNGTWTATPGPDAEDGLITISFTSATAFTVTYTHLGVVTSLGVGSTAGFQHPIISLQVTGTFTTGDLVTIPLNYEWKRQGVFNLVQSSTPVLLNLQREVLAKAVRVVPTLYTGAGNWEIASMDVLDSPPTDINNIQDLFFNENRDRDYAKTPLVLKAQYSINNSVTDLSKFGLNILDQYSFVASFPVMVGLLGRPLVTGDIIEVVPERQYDQNLKTVRKFLEVTDTGWAAEGFSTGWKPSLYRFSAQQALPSQETRDIFGTIDTQKYMVADSFFNDLGVGPQIDTTPLSTTEEINKTAKQKVPETGDDLGVSADGMPGRQPTPPVNLKGQPEALSPVPTKQNIYVEDGLPPNDQPYGEGYTLPDLTSATDGDYFRLYYPENTKIAPRLYRYSAVKNKWIFMEQDRRSAASSLKPSLQKIMQSPTKQGLGKKQV